jgi:hypothetical protein
MFLKCCSQIVHEVGGKEGEMDVCQSHSRKDLTLISCGQGWADYCCRKCGAYGYVNLDERWGGPVGEFILFEGTRCTIRNHEVFLTECPTAGGKEG